MFDLSVFLDNVFLWGTIGLFVSRYDILRCPAPDDLTLKTITGAGNELNGPKRPSFR